MVQSLSFTDKLIVVTGAAQRIGVAVARSLIGAGAVVVGFDIQPDKLELVRAELSPQRFNPYEVDVSDSLTVDKHIQHIERSLGPIRGFNAGLGEFYRLLRRSMYRRRFQHD